MPRRSQHWWLSAQMDARWQSLWFETETARDAAFIAVIDLSAEFDRCHQTGERPSDDARQAALLALNILWQLPNLLDPDYDEELRMHLSRARAIAYPQGSA